MEQFVKLRVWSFHKLKDCVNFMCNSGAKIEITKHSRCQFLTSERQHLHDKLYLVDLSIVSFDEEFQLSGVLYSLDEFNYKMNR